MGVLPGTAVKGIQSSIRPDPEYARRILVHGRYDVGAQAVGFAGYVAVVHKAGITPIEHADAALGADPYEPEASS